MVGDLVLITAGDQVPADGRIVAASAADRRIRPDRGGVPADKSADTLAEGDLPPGEQTNMAFMNSPVTHGSGELIVTATGLEPRWAGSPACWPPRLGRSRRSRSS